MFKNENRSTFVKGLYRVNYFNAEFTGYLD